MIIHVYSAALILQGSLPLVYRASEGGHLAIVELLVSRGARIDQPCDVRLIICIHANYWETQNDPYKNYSCIICMQCTCLYVVIHTSTCSLAHNAYALLLQSIIVGIVEIDHMLTLMLLSHQTKAQADTEWRRETRKRERVGDQCTRIVSICSNKAPQ